MCAHTLLFFRGKKVTPCLESNAQLSDNENGAIENDASMVSRARHTDWRCANNFYDSGLYPSQRNWLIESQMQDFISHFMAILMRKVDMTRHLMRLVFSVFA